MESFENEEKIDYNDQFNKNKNGKDNLGGFGVRRTLCLMGSLAFACMFSHRVNLSVAIVAMVKKHHVEEKDISESSFSSEYYEGNSSFSDANFDWDEKTQGHILGSFFYGYAITNIIGGPASHHFGARLVAGVGIGITSLLTFLTPLAAEASPGYLKALRVAEGCFQGLSFPAINALIAKWYPINERSKYTTIIFSGISFGTVATMSVSGWLCSTDFLGGWPSVFYLTGVVGIVWAIFWFLVIRNEPSKHPFISPEELQYIQEGCPDTKERLSVPWSSIFHSRYFWVLLIMHFGSNWGFYIMLTELPTYLDTILHIPLRSNGLLSSMPYLFSWLFSILYSFIIEKVTSKSYLSILSVRRLSMAIAGYGPMVCLLAICFLNCEAAALVVFFFVVSGTLHGAAFCGLQSSHADIAPRYAGTLTGLTNSFATIPGFAGPALTGFLIEEKQTMWAWRIVFLICVFIYGISTTIYIAFITTKLQAWNDPLPQDKKDQIISLNQRFPPRIDIDPQGSTEALRGFTKKNCYFGGP